MIDLQKSPVLMPFLAALQAAFNAAVKAAVDQAVAPLADRIAALETGPSAIVEEQRGIDDELVQIKQRLTALESETQGENRYLNRNDVSALIEESISRHQDNYDHDEFDRVVREFDEADIDDLPDFDDFVRKDDLPDLDNLPDFDDLVKKDDLPDFDDFVTDETIDDKVRQALDGVKVTLSV